MFEQAAAEGTAEREFVTVALFVPLQETQATEGLVTKLTWVRETRSSFILAKVIVFTVSRGSLILTGGR